MSVSLRVPRVHVDEATKNRRECTNHGKIGQTERINAPKRKSERMAYRFFSKTYRSLCTDKKS